MDNAPGKGDPVVVVCVQFYVCSQVDAPATDTYGCYRSTILEFDG